MDEDLSMSLLRLFYFVFRGSRWSPYLYQGNFHGHFASGPPHGVVFVRTALIIVGLQAAFFPIPEDPALPVPRLQADKWE